MSQSTQPTFVPIPSSQLGGAIAVNIFAALSTVALVSVVFRISWLAIQRTFFKSSTTAKESIFFHTQLGHYAACLIIALMFNAVAGMVGIHWYFRGGIVEDRNCRTQAFIMQIGNFSSAYFTNAIAVHTFNSLVIRRRQSVIVCRSTIAIGWVWAGLMAGAPFLIHASDGYVYGADGLACGVRPVYPKLQFFFHLLPILIASTVGTVLYSLIFLILRGTLKIKSGIKLTLNPNERWTNSEDLEVNYHRFIARIAKSMLWYPVAYVVLLVPYAVTGLFGISGFRVPFEAVLFASFCWYMLSVVDVLLLYNTFRVLGPAFEARSAAPTQFSSFGTAGELEKYAPSLTNSQRSEMQEKIYQYRSEKSGSHQSSPSENSWSGSSNTLLPLHHGHDERVRDSFYSYSNSSMLGRPITPAGFNYDVTVPPQAATSMRKPSRDLGEHRRTESLTSVGLPAPPRRNRSPVLSQLRPEQRNSASAHELDVESWMDRQRSTHTFGHPDAPPEKSPSLMSEAPEWSSRRLTYDNRSPGFSNSGHTSFGSAIMASSIPSNLILFSSPPQSSLDRSLSATSTLSSPPSRGPRPLLLTRPSNSLDSMNNLYRSGPTSITRYPSISRNP